MQFRRISAFLALALALSTSLVPVASLAGTVTLVGPEERAPLAYPGSAEGALRNWVQLVWNPTSRQLERISYTAWDPIASLGLDLQWQPDDPAAIVSGPLSGKGTLSFRKPGAAAYDPSGTVAQYRGSMNAGRADGRGEFLDNGGFAYSGEWRTGLMDGKGRLALANGDEYVGEFLSGKRQGKGVFIDATGAIYDGKFLAGERNGEGIFVPAAGDAYGADWDKGTEVPGTRHMLPVGVLPYPRIANAQFAEVDGLRIGVVAERRPHNYEIGIDPLSYTAKSNGQILEILPDDQRLLDVWHGKVPISMTPDEILAFDNISTTPSFLGPAERFDPLSLVFEIENSTTDTVSVVGGFLNVDASRRDPEPAIQIRPVPRDPCSGAVDFLPRFFIDNFGWTPADNATLNVTAGAIDGRSEGTPLSVDLGSVNESAMSDLTAQVTQLGLDTDYVSNNKLVCTDPNDERLCLGELRQSGYFGKLAPFITLDYLTVTIAINGTLDYDWTGSDGAVNHKSSPFSAVLPIASVASEAECGEGGEIIPVSHDPFMLHLDETNYKIAIPFAGDVTPGFTSRWRIELQAPETSEHEFQLVLLLADGRQIASRPVQLTYFIPPKHTVLN
ncbi:MAG: hypothetical protein ABIQ30_17635 [Devosia sp.]